MQGLYFNAICELKKIIDDILVVFLKKLIQNGSAVVSHVEASMLLLSATQYHTNVKKSEFGLNAVLTAYAELRCKTGEREAG